MASVDSEAAMRKYQQLVNEEKPKRNPLGMKIEVGEDGSESEGFAHLPERTPKQIRDRQQREFQTPKAPGQNSSTLKLGRISGYNAMMSHRKALGSSIVSARSRGSNNRSFNMMTSRGSAHRPF